MIIRNISVYNTSQKSFHIADVEIRGGLYYMIGKIDRKSEFEFDGSGTYLVPGLIDVHMHIESSMTTPQEFSNIVLPMGTTTIVADAHEVANALGLEGLLEYMDSKQDMDIFYAIPSSVPSTNQNLETSKGFIGEKEVEVLCQNPKIRALGEIMNFKDVVSGEDSVTKRIIDKFRNLKPLFPIEGHVPLVKGEELARFAMTGIGSDHTHQSVESLLEKTRAGFLIQLQEKSMTGEIFKAIEAYGLEEFICFVTDDVMPDDLLKKGHLNYLIKQAVSLGYPVEKAIYAATKIPAQRMLFNDRGIIAPGRIADGLIISDLEKFTIKEVIKNGKFVSAMGRVKVREYPSHMNNSITRKLINHEDLIIRTEGDRALVRVIERETESTFTRERQIWIDVEDGRLLWKKAGLNLICVAERYGNQRPLAVGFVLNGFNKKFAMASSWTHDSHNLLAMGTDEALIVRALNALIEKQGGMICLDDEKESFLPLRFGGVVSLEPMEVLASKLEVIRERMVDAGYKSHNEIMSFCTLALLCTPSLKISDRGYVDVRSQEILNWRVDL